jgi:hypothetical protein|tara:strand:- start:380 stop:562 length:183 start_codon:yes stop_codon:yes gene_type:complete
MKTFLKNFIILILFSVFTQSCSTAVTVVDTTVSTTTKIVTGTAKGIVHVTTCPFTDKECF